ncbi:MAG: SPP1 family predicted phage head-tail adaptor [Paracoccaceae bacterium]|jgi:SPP1 family predicted phage head-tail adaptor
MEAGRLDRRVTLRRATAAPDAFNEPVQTWADLATVWAEARPISDRERIAAAQIAATVTHRFTIRWADGLADLSPRDRLIFEAREFDISAVKEIGRRDGLEITASARADQ